MKRTCEVIVAGIMLLASGTVCCQAPDARHVLLEAKKCLRQGDNTARGEEYQRAKAFLSKNSADGEFTALTEYYMGYADYRLGVVVYRMEKENAIAYLDSAVEHLEKAIAHQDDFAEAHALLSSCYGVKISFAPFKGIVLGPKSGLEMEKARDFAPENPRVALLGAISTYSIPSFLGGGKDKGLEALKKASELFVRWQTADTLLPDWGAAEVHAWIGLAHLDRDEMILARNAFETALRINPDYGWVKYQLLPQVTSQTGVR